MLKALEAIERFKAGDQKVLKEEKWLMYLALTSERNINLERINSLEEMKNNYVLRYVENTLLALEESELDSNKKFIVEEVLKWSEVAKAGMSHHRKRWINKGFNLFAHNIGSAQIFCEDADYLDSRLKTIINYLIMTHGLIGQYIRGEVTLIDSRPIFLLVKEKFLEPYELLDILMVLNCCIIKAIDVKLWENIRNDVEAVIEDVVEGSFEKQHTIRERIRRLRTISIKNGEDFESEYNKHLSHESAMKAMESILKGMDLWYVEAALFDFSFEEFVKIFLLIYKSVDFDKVKHISFEGFMKELYYQHNGKKRVNIYKKRIVEKYLQNVTIEDILKENFKANPHLIHETFHDKDLDDTVFFNFRFSPAASKLIDFCVEAEKSDVMYERAIVLLFDLFGLRKDKYDRFYEEESYLSVMNQTINYKKIILDYVIGSRIIDIGPGGGAMMDLIEESFPDKYVAGVDIAQNVIDALKKKKQIENRKWEVLYGDALNLSKYLKKDSIDTIMFCSILHELYSYIEFKGKKFNHETLEAAFKSAFDVLAHGGRIIIRDGIMSEPIEEKRIIRFLSQEGMEFLERYARDFKGRMIEYKKVGQNEVIMLINDAMEFLYTYTWGERSYVHEVNEQFGYFTPSGFKKFIKTVLGEGAKIVEFKHFLQDGYTVALSQKVELFDEARNPVRLPDSTCLVVIEKS
ncbi:MAG: class I SAM-dependent methyltransferase [Bacillota bacterium]|nr:class I SAM-dependent methyltransferase [Bacillota bacterium]